MNLNQLRVFHLVAQQLSISSAARQLRVSQPAVSRQVSELERDLELRLLDRLPRGIRLTPAGRSLYEHTQEMFRIERAAEERLTALKQKKDLRLAVGASTTVGSYLVPGIFGELRRRHPELELTLKIGNTDAILELVRDDVVDLGLTEGLSEAGDLQIEAFSEDELLAIASPKARIASAAQVTLAEFLAEPLIVREPGSGTRAVLEEALSLRGLVPKRSLELGSTEAIKNAVESALGVAFISSLTVDLEFLTGRLRRIVLSDFRLTRQLHSVQLPHRSLTPLAATFLEALKRPRSRLGLSEYSI